MKKNFEIDWVLQNELAVGPAPRGENDLNLLLNEGIIGILCLCSEKEIKSPKDIAEHFTFIRYVLPDHKYKEKLTLIQLVKCLEILTNIKQKGPVFILNLA